MGLRATFILMVGIALGSVGLVAVGTAGSTSAAEGPASASFPTRNLIRNGGFEAPVITRPWVAFFADGERRIPGWWVVRHSVDLVSTDWPAGRGSQSLGLNGFRRGWVSQFVATDANTSYRLSFLLWGDPNGPPARSRLAVRWDLERIGVRKVDVNAQSTWRRVTSSWNPPRLGPTLDSAA